jgi:dephospho-CoA kinase
MWDAARRARAADDVIENGGDEAALLPQVDAYIARYAAP